MEPVGMTNACATVVVPNKSMTIVTAHSAMLFRGGSVPGVIFVALETFGIDDMGCPSIIACAEKSRGYPAKGAVSPRYASFAANPRLR